MSMEEVEVNSRSLFEKRVASRNLLAFLFPIILKMSSVLGDNLSSLIERTLLIPVPNLR
eukprot:TRINITY_DN6023_c0_g1_i1.p2 TRINITY_DN6023_c0_g1~~TRINITY_DN6023_c0_g1_i1.p2  ORF type:complete len:59 (-),score=5.24 TRINITY_DN6023_c0_g1_i1:135-311(-)